MGKEQVNAADAKILNAPTAGATELVLDAAMVELIGGIVVGKLKEILPPIVEAQLLEHLTGDDAVKGPSIEDVLTKVKGELPALIEELVPSAKAAREAAEAEAEREQQAETARARQAREEKRALRAQAESAEKRAAAIKEAGERWGDLFGPGAMTEGFAVGDLTVTEGTRQLVTLAIDDGKALCVDFHKMIDPGQLEQVDDMVRLSSAIQLPADIPAFAVRGVVLILDSAHAMRCEIPTPLQIGEGRNAMLAADSLVFRAPIAA